MIRKKEAVEFCMRYHVIQKMVDIWLTVLLTLGLAVIIFPILLWLIYRYYKAKKDMNGLRDRLNRDPGVLDSVQADIGYSYTRFGQKINNSVVVEVGGLNLEIPQLYIWFSKYSTKEKLIEALKDRT